ncbi:hybrid sensor histidine kinase/response regulator [Massilia alkalitolerans]|uniref:hybrid sensor histidine kinase/response regulator n=1 Tax=Massilia alkalitolerans TaxID=286638 RepID=UPI00146FA441|nr:ATP-binding protein [Massilia alkalitolerans]
MMLNSKFPMFIAWGAELGFLYNDAYAHILGNKHPSALGGRFQEIWSEIWTDILPIIEQALEGHAVYYENLPFSMNRNGHDEKTWFTFSYSPVRDEDGQVGGMFCACTETTGQVLAEQHRAQELTRLRQLFQQAPGIIAVLRGPTHVFDIANEAYLRLVGHRDPIGKAIREALPELSGQGFFELLDEVYATGRPYFGNEVPVRLQRQPQGVLEERFVNFIYQPTYDYRGNITGIFVEGSDVTDSVKVHQALQKSESELRAANRRKDEFLAMLAHELRNPLAPIASASALLRISPKNEALVRRSSEVITRQVEHMTELVDDLLDVSRVTRGLVTLQLETLSLGSVLEVAVEQVRPLVEAKEHELVVQLPNVDLLVRGDRTRLIQAFSNILNNAAKYTPQHGQIVLHVIADSEHVQVVIGDNGIGIAPSLLPDIFTLFTQAERSSDRAQGGLGLGLALVKSLVEMQGGRVAAHSDGPEQGSRFTVWLPRVLSSEIPSGPSRENCVRPGTAGTTVLVVDDNKDAAETLHLLLEAIGHDVFVAHSPEEALKLAREVSPAILFLDIGLPGMDGYELARRLRAHPATELSTFIALTGYGQEDDRQNASDAGFDRFLVKPVMLNDVLDWMGAANL